MPKPSIRFIIPLTKSIKECNEADSVSSAYLLIVLNDRWFSEAGLAEKLEIGIGVLTSPAEKNGKYLNVGHDPILANTSLGSYTPPVHGGLQIESTEGEKDIAIFPPTGPVGLTFDFVAQTPRLKGCAFVLDVPDIVTRHS